ncbi:MAG: hypothetical protein OIN88_03410 [Candidatus Methanoperedens sp.]|nr:hypothetical protein [Candidatus Methanoperedens sp.]MCZ7360217.1 hypothetical protein [Candidatus Methanoperedens sp.]HLB70144.1 hypothetical protein [Candidatus Methanoperedens sp.]
MIEEICSQSRRKSSFELKTENDIEFDKIVKFLNAQKAAMDYAGLN